LAAVEQFEPVLRVNIAVTAPVPATVVLERVGQKLEGVVLEATPHLMVPT